MIRADADFKKGSGRRPYTKIPSIVDQTFRAPSASHTLAIIELRRLAQKPPPTPSARARAQLCAARAAAGAAHSACKAKDRPSGLSDGPAQRKGLEPASAALRQPSRAPRKSRAGCFA